MLAILFIRFFIRFPLLFNFGICLMQLGFAIFPGYIEPIARRMTSSSTTSAHWVAIAIANCWRGFSTCTFGQNASWTRLIFHSRHFPCLAAVQLSESLLDSLNRNQMSVLFGFPPIYLLMISSMVKPSVRLGFSELDDEEDRSRTGRCCTKFSG